MSKKPVLVIMAAGMGSRYGGLKQIDPVDPYGNMIIDAGFTGRWKTRSDCRSTGRLWPTGSS